MNQTFLDLSAMLLTEGWDINFNVDEVQSTMERYFDKEYARSEVEEAIGYIAEQLRNQTNDYTY